MRLAGRRQSDSWLQIDKTKRFRRSGDPVPRCQLLIFGSFIAFIKTRIEQDVKKGLLYHAIPFTTTKILYQKSYLGDDLFYCPGRSKTE